MNRKLTFRSLRLLVVTLSALMVFLAQARAAVTVYADEPASNAAVMAIPSTVETNVPATQTNLITKGRSRDGNPQVRIDETGIHIGGPKPVDIELPASARRHMYFGGAAENLKDIVAIIAIFGMPVFIIAIAGYFAHRRNKMAHDTIRAMIDKGVPMTPELVAELKSKPPYGSSAHRSRSGRLFPGLVCIGVGTALLISGKGDTRGGWIVLFIGLAFLITWVVDQNNRANTPPPQQ